MIIAITLPDMHTGEAIEIVRLLRSDVSLVHIRKPNVSAEDVERLIRLIPKPYRRRLVLHDHFSLAGRYRLYGVHLNSRNPEPPKNWKGSVSRSCHSLEEVAAWKDRCNYVSLSPIFDSISKPDYKATFTREEIDDARKKGIIDNKVLALGGVTFDRMDEVYRMGFGGGMMLGDAWHALTDAPLTPTALSIAGSDPSAGAGIQQDMKTMHSLGVYCATVPTALTIQNTMGVQDFMRVDPDTIESQLDAVLTDMNIGAIKIGMIPSERATRRITRILTEYKKMCPECKIVLDPVMAASSGSMFMDDLTIKILTQKLFPLCTLITPNLPEARELMRILHLYDSGDYSYLAKYYECAFLVKGGHAEGKILTDRLYLPDGTTVDFSSRRIKSNNLHGTGCTLSSAITAYLLQGYELEEAIRKAKKVMNRAIKKGADMRIGHGHGPLIL